MDVLSGAQVRGVFEQMCSFVRIAENGYHLYPSKGIIREICYVYREKCNHILIYIHIYSEERCNESVSRCFLFVINKDKIKQRIY